MKRAQLVSQEIQSCGGAYLTSFILAVVQSLLQRYVQKCRASVCVLVVVGILTTQAQAFKVAINLEVTWRI